MLRLVEGVMLPKGQCMPSAVHAAVWAVVVAAKTAAMSVVLSIVTASLSERMCFRKSKF